ncbi:type I glyceraldehyde-3-phosphate dehydrogenase [Desulfovibrio sp. PG-178-WT-4]|uniref:Glyceraldehyde-3-phosphate dehydrogenase n=1 Tax=Desulfovibrio porci TaxID=2605782 RepID=A0A6L5XP58_9BACT|nr:type I glyceraldehyde-3-phosphate dehydrogenase [Desulfovibrio porci]MDY3808704.1 type I glyceraldehyde-3-phosphate dehydrogenase [Desulfovibrio porci]MSS28865.1 type I glyceraldehyde-3-phosphate dehydrogenase [Desulfovibrio porci]
MPVKLGMNGFGRIGRYLLRLLADDQDLQIAAVNARADNAALAYLFKYDSTYGVFAGEVGHDDDGIIVNGRHIAVTRCKAGEWEWERLGVTLAVETTGTIKDREGLSRHLDCGAKKVVISAPGKGVDAMIVMGVNQDIYDPAKHAIISAASCTTNCLAPAVKVVHENFGFRHGLMTTIHSYTMSQRILDGSHKDWRRGRAAAVSMVPSSTGAAKAVGVVMPELEGRINGMSVRVPTFDCSLVDLTCEVEKACDAEAVNAALKAASRGALCDNMGFSEEPLVSIDYRGSTYGGVVDALSTQVLDQSMVKLLIWYDNEAGFTNQLLRLLRMVGKDC